MLTMWLLGLKLLMLVKLVNTRMRQHLLFARFSTSSKLFTDTHEWIQNEGEQIVRDQLGEIVYCDMPDVGTVLKKGQALCTLESVKAVGEVYAPIDGTIVETNPELASEPMLVNKDPEGRGWLVKLKYSEELASKKWRDAVSYEEFVKSLSEH